MNEKIDICLVLRFGEDREAKKVKTHLSYMAISRLLKVPYSTVRLACIRYEKAL